MDFEAVNEVWPYLLEERFGSVCLCLMQIEALPGFKETDCLRLALAMDLPLKEDTGLPLPVDARAVNPISASEFRAFRIQSVRRSTSNEDVVPFTKRDDPFDKNFGSPFFGIYGESADGLSEHVADRETYAEAVVLLRKLAPGISFAK